MTTFPVTLRFDGGCFTTPQDRARGEKYGSYGFYRMSQGREVIIKHRRRFKLGLGTNNEAEFEALLTGLKEGIADCEAGGIDTHRLFLRILTDSTIVANRVSGKKTGASDDRALKMQVLTAQALDLLEAFAGFEILWNDRTHNVAAFGH